MSLCAHTCMYAHAYINVLINGHIAHTWSDRIFIAIETEQYMFMCTCICICIWSCMLQQYKHCNIRMCVHVYVCNHVCLCVHAFMYILCTCDQSQILAISYYRFVYASMYVCTYSYAYVHIVHVWPKSDTCDKLL